MIKYLVVDQSTGSLYYLYKRFKIRRPDPVPSGLYDHDALTIRLLNLREYCDAFSTMSPVSAAGYLPLTFLFIADPKAMYPGLVFLASFVGGLYNILKNCF